jgi:hypothetical protein
MNEPNTGRDETGGPPKAPVGPRRSPIEAPAHHDEAPTGLPPESDPAQTPEADPGGQMAG